jgi:hypothetical protein
LGLQQGTRHFPDNLHLNLHACKKGCKVLWRGVLRSFLGCYPRDTEYNTFANRWCGESTPYIWSELPRCTSNSPWGFPGYTN